MRRPGWPGAAKLANASERAQAFQPKATPHATKGARLPDSSLGYPTPPPAGCVPIRALIGTRRSVPPSRGTPRRGGVRLSSARPPTHRAAQRGHGGHCGGVLRLSRIHRGEPPTGGASLRVCGATWPGTVSPAWRAKAIPKRAAPFAPVKTPHLRLSVLTAKVTKTLRKPRGRLYLCGTIT